MRSKALFAGAALALSAWLPAHGAVLTFQDRASFNAAIAGWATGSVDFDSTAAGTQYGAGTGPAGAPFTMTLSGLDAGALTPTVSSTFWTTSGSNYLGLDNGDTALEQGDVLSFDFGGGVHAFGLYVVGTQDVGAGDIVLQSGAFSVANSASWDMSDGAGSYAYFIGMVSDGADVFTSLSLSDLTAADTRLLNVTLDDITYGDQQTTRLPLPATLPLVLLGLALLRCQYRANQ